MKTITHLCQTVLLVLLGLLIFQGSSVITVPDWVPYVTLGLAFACGIGLVYYVVKVKKIALFSFMLILGLSLNTTSLYAQVPTNELSSLNLAASTGFNANTGITQSPVDFAQAQKSQMEAIQKQILEKRDTVCNAKEEEYSYSNQILKDAYFIADTYAKTQEAAKTSPWATLNKSELKKANKCALNYINHVAKVKKRNQELPPTVGERIISESGDCWPCNLSFLMIDAIQRMASATSEPITYVALMLLGVFLLFWVAFRVLKLIGQLGFASNAEFFTDLVNRFIAVAIAAVLLQAPIIDFYRITLSPLIGLTATLSSKFSEYSLADEKGQTFAEAMMLKLSEKAASDCTPNVMNRLSNKMPVSSDRTGMTCCVVNGGEWRDGVCEGMTGEAVTKEGLSCSYCKYAMDPEYKIPRTSEAFIPVFDDQTVNSLLCMVCTVYKQMVPMTAAGRTIFRYAGQENAFKWPWPLIDAPRPFFGLWLGAALVIGFSILMFMVAFKLIDIFLRIGFVIVLTPLFITAWAYPVTRQYAERAWQFILYVLFEFLSLSVITALLMNLFTAMLPESSETSLVDAMSGTDPEKLYLAFTGDATGGVFYTLLTLTVTCIIGVYMFKASDKIVEALTGLQPSVTGLTAGGAMNMMKTGAKAGSAVAGATGVKGAAKEFSKGVSNSVTGGFKAFKKARETGASMKDARKAANAVAQEKFNYGVLKTRAGLRHHYKGIASDTKHVGGNFKGVAKGVYGVACHPLKTAGRIKDKAVNGVKNTIADLKNFKDKAIQTTAFSAKRVARTAKNLSQLARNPALASKIAAKYGGQKGKRL